jgi:hypothetical protein
MNPTDPKPLGLVIAMPTRGTVSVETMLCLREHLDGYPNKLTAIRKPVVEARNQLAKEVRELDANSLDFDPRYILWADDDCWFPPGHVDKAVGILEANPDVSMVVGAYCGRIAYLPPLAIVTDGKDAPGTRGLCPRGRRRNSFRLGLEAALTAVTVARHRGSV